MKIPRPRRRAWRIMIDGTNYWMEANSKLHAQRMSKALAADMRQSEKLRRAFTISPGNVGVGHAGLVRARKGARNG